LTDDVWLIDKSALARINHVKGAATWANRIERGLVRIAGITRLEVGYSAQSGDDARRLFSTPPITAMPIEYSTLAVENRALEIQILLADKGMHRAPSISDLIVGATAELARLVVLHVDKDFELIARITGQRTERLDI